MADLDQIFKDCKRRKLKSVSPTQTAAMLVFLERHPDLAVNKCRPNAGALWAQCADILNALANTWDGPTRTGAQWSKFFSDLKYRARRKALELKIADGSSVTGEEVSPLTPMEERLLSLIGEKEEWATVVKGDKALEEDPLYVSDSEEEDNFCVPSDPANLNTSANKEDTIANKTAENNSNVDFTATKTDNTNNNPSTTKVSATDLIATATDGIYEEDSNNKQGRTKIVKDSSSNKNYPNATTASAKDEIANASDRISKEDSNSSNSKHGRTKITKDANSFSSDEVETRDSRKRRRVETPENDNGCSNDRPQMNGNGHSSKDFEHDDDIHTESFLRLEERKVAYMERLADAVCAMRDELAKAVDVLTDIKDFILNR